MRDLGVRRNDDVVVGNNTKQSVRFTLLLAYVVASRVWHRPASGARHTARCCCPYFVTQVTLKWGKICPNLTDRKTVYLYIQGKNAGARARPTAGQIYHVTACRLAMHCETDRHRERQTVRETLNIFSTSKEVSSWPTPSRFVIDGGSQ